MSKPVSNSLSPKLAQKKSQGDIAFEKFNNTKNSNQERIKALRSQVDKELEGRILISKEKVQTVGKALFEMAQIFNKV